MQYHESGEVKSNWNLAFLPHLAERNAASARLSDRIRQRLRQSFNAGGFTLVELIAVLTILAILTSITAWSLRSHLDQTTRSLAINQLQEADQQARWAAQKLAGTKVTLEIQKHAIRIAGLSRQYSLPKGVVAQLRFADGREGQGVRIPYYGNGTSTSYLVKLEAGQVQSWLCVFGLSGQFTVTDNLLTAQELLDDGR